MGSIICDIVEITDESESYGRNVGGFSALAVIPFTFFQNSHLQTPHSLQNKKEMPVRNSVCSRHRNH